MGGVEGDHRVTGCAKRASSLESCDPWKITAVPRRSRVGRGCEPNVGAAAAGDSSHLKCADDSRAEGKRARLDLGSVLARGIGKRVLTEPGESGSLKVTGWRRGGGF